jgi:hypothetical protein
LVVEGIQHTQAWLGHFGRIERDLLRVASAVLDVDRLSLRRPLCTKETKRELYGGSFIAVSAVGNEVRRQAQATARKTLLDLGVPVTAVSVVHQLRRDANRTRRSMESTQRTRGLLFLAMGAAVASAIGNERFHVYETGIGALNVPTSAAQIASQASIRRADSPLSDDRASRTPTQA